MKNHCDVFVYCHWREKPGFSVTSQILLHNAALNEHEREVKAVNIIKSLQMLRRLMKSCIGLLNIYLLDKLKCSVNKWIVNILNICAGVIALHLHHPLILIIKTLTLCRLGGSRSVWTMRPVPSSCTSCGYKQTTHSLSMWIYEWTNAFRASWFKIKKHTQCGKKWIHVPYVQFIVTYGLLNCLHYAIKSTMYHLQINALFSVMDINNGLC